MLIKGVLAKRVRWAWFLTVLGVCAASAVLWQIWTGGPPANSVLITSADEPGTTGGATSQSNRVSATPYQVVVESTQIASRPSQLPTDQLQVGNVSKIGLSSSPLTATAESLLPTSTPQTIVVYISGAVQKPGVYTLPVGSRIAEALSAAGGSTDGASLDNINLAERLWDEEHVLVPRIGDPTAGVTVRPSPTRTPRNAASGETSSPSVSKSSPLGKININIATSEELEGLPGIGPTLAGRIVEYRAANGPYKAIEELMEVSGIKEGVFSKMREYVTVGP